MSPTFRPKPLPRFTLSSRNSFSLWLAHLVILPVYITAVYLASKEVQSASLIPDPWRLPIVIAIWVVFLLPLINAISLPRRWQRGFENVEPVVIVAPFIVLAWHRQALELPHDVWFSNGWFQPTDILVSIAAVTGVWMLVGVGRIMRHLPLFANLILGACLLILLVIGIVITIIQAQPGTQVLYFLYSCLLAFWGVVALLALGYAFYRWVSWYNSNKNYSQNIAVKAPYFAASVIAVAGLAIIWGLSSTYQPKNLGLTASIGLLILLITGNIRYIISQQIASLRNLFTPLRHDRFNGLVSPFVPYHHWINRLLYYWFPKWLTFNNLTLFILLASVTGALGVPYLFYQVSIAMKESVSASTLFWIGLVSATVLVMFYLGFWAIRYGNRYIVTEFEVSTHGGDRFEPEIRAIGKLTTHVLVEELQRIATLLKLRQVENLRFSHTDNNAFFVTSGINQEFFDQMQQVVTVEMPHTKGVNLGAFFGLLARAFARIQVKGKVQQRSNGSVEIWVELKRRNNQSAAVDMVILPENSVQEIDEIFIRPIARELALNLLIELGQVPHLGSSWKTLDYFLQGLDASANRNWWQAISFYRKSLQAEETIHGSFGIGHYHLGAALVLQGSWQQGLMHLRIAEADGPPMAELEYMIALVQLYSYWGSLTDHPLVFKEIQERCKRAIRLRKHFAEAYQLLGGTHHRIAKNWDRETTKSSKINQNSNTDQNSKKQPELRVLLEARHHYGIAAWYYWHAIRHYDRMYSRRINDFPTIYSETQDQLGHLIRQRMTAAHQLGDVLRGLGRYAEAESYYNDVKVIFPRTNKNLSDIAKNYCLASNWQVADEFLQRDVLSDERLKWDVDLSFHAAWAIFAGLYECNTREPKRKYDKIVRSLLRWNAATSHEPNTESPSDWLSSGLDHLDIALYLRPRYGYSWRQSDWYDSLERACRQFQTRQEGAQVPPPYFIKLGNKITNDRDLVHYIKTWVNLRLQKFDLKSDFGTNGQKDSYCAAFLEEVKKGKPWKPFYCLTNKLLQHRKTAIERDDIGNKKSPLGSLFNLYKRLQLAQELYRDNDFQNAIEAFANKTLTVENNNFATQWALDVFLDFTLLLCRLLAETECYTLLYDLTKKVNDLTIVADVQRLLRKKETAKVEAGKQKSEQDRYLFSRFVLTYQIATLEAWYAYAITQTAIENSTPIAEQASKPAVASTSELDKAQSSINSVRQVISNHPLVIYTQALVYHARGIHEQAIDEFQHLIDIIVPFDPKQHIGGIELEQTSPKPTINPGREQLYYMEKVCGRQQFHNLINPAVLHVRIANLYQEMDKPDLMVRHLMEAVRYSPHDDVDVEIFLRLAMRLTSMERYGDAQAVVEALRASSVQLKSTELSESKQVAADVLESVINTRQTSYMRSTEQATRLAYRLNPHDLNTLVTKIATLQVKKNANKKPSGNSQFDQLKGCWPFPKTLRNTNALQTTLENDCSDTLATLSNEELQEDFSNILKICRNILLMDGHNLPPEIYATLKSTPNSLTKLYKQAFTNIGKTPNNIATFATFLQKIQQVNNNSTKVNTPLPRTFHTLIHREAAQGSKNALNKFLEETATLAWFSLVAQELLKPDGKEKFEHLETFGALTTKEIRQVMFTHIALYFGRQARYTLVQIADLCNAIAYNEAETGLHDKSSAFDHILCALAIMLFLSEAANPYGRYHRLYTEKLAQFYDTYGWLQYRSVLPLLEDAQTDKAKAIEGSKLIAQAQHGLRAAEEAIRQGIRYDAKHAIIHYHLARVYLSSAELLWQAEPEGIVKAEIAQKAYLLDNYITLAFREWRHASSLDEYGQIHSRLTWLHQRVTAYKNEWEKRQREGIAGRGSGSSEKETDKTK